VAPAVVLVLNLRDIGDFEAPTLEPIAHLDAESDAAALLRTLSSRGPPVGAWCLPAGANGAGR